VPPFRLSRPITATFVGLAAVTGLVLGGALTRLDEWGLDHVRPGLDPRVPNNGIVSFNSLWRPFALHTPWWQKALDVYTYPASVLVSALVVAIAFGVLVRRRQRLAALMWLGAWIAASAIELVGKHLLTRPSLYWTNGHVQIHVAPFDNSFPSGHTTRAVVVAAIVAFVWRRARTALAVWLAFVPAALVVVAAHTITDVIGGLLLGALIVLLAHAMIGAWTPSATFLRNSNEESSETRKPSWPTSPARRSSSRPAS
jgi:membrane-associated phospholipid phosphatase